MIQYTSALALREHAKTLANLKKKVLYLVDSADEQEGISNHEIAHLLEVQTATISGLMRPLVVENKVRQLKKRECQITGNLVIAWERSRDTLFS